MHITITTRSFVFLYIYEEKSLAMKSTQLLSVVLSLIMFTGVTAGNTAFAESDDIDDILEDYCEMTTNDRSDILSKYELDEYAEKLATVCDMDDDVRDDALDSVIDAIELEVFDEIDDDSDDVIDSYEDCVEAGYPIMESFPEKCAIDDGTVFTNTDDDYDDDYDRYDKHGSLEDRLEYFCELTDEEKKKLYADHPRVAQYSDRLANYCEMSEDDREDAIEDFVAEHFPGEREHDFDLDDLLDRYCGLNATDKRQLLAEHPRLAPFTDRLANYCDLSEDEQDAIDELIEDHGDKIRSELRDYSKDYVMDYKKDMREHLDRYCEMSDEEKRAFVAENDKAEDHVEKMNRFCTLDESDRMSFIEEHRDEYMKHMKDKMHGTMTDKKHMDYDRLCAMAASDRASEITDVAKLDRISKWCEMSTEEREDYKKEHHDEMKEKVHDKVMDKKHDKMEKFSEKSDRLKAMIMDKRDISDERHDEIKMKFEAKFGEDSDKKRSEIKMKYKDHMVKMKFKMSDERKSDVHDRLAEMKAYKAELREKSSELSEQEKQQLREEFIEKAKDMQLAWISPRTQMTAGIDSAEVECREGFSLVMKASNGVAMCLKADTALKMIDRGIVVPAI